MLKDFPVHWYTDDPVSDPANGSGQAQQELSGWRLSVWAAYLAAVICAALALLTCSLVLLGAFNWVHNGMEELKWHLCGSLFLLSGAYCLQRNAHVRVDTFYARFSPRIKALVDAVGIVVFLWPMAMAVCYYGLFVAIDSMAEASNDAGGLSHRWLIKLVIPVGFALLLLQSLAVFLRAVLCMTAARAVDEAADA